MLPRGLRYALIILAALALVPPVLIARARTVKSAQPRIHPIQDMDNQPRFKSQQVNSLFADRRAMRRPMAGTIARDDLPRDDHFQLGKVEGQWATTFPMPVTEDLMQRGQERFVTYCSPCHGLDGSGRGMVAVRAEELEEPTWVPPLSYHNDEVRSRPVGHIFNTITHGIRTMPAHGPQIEVADRWAIVAYVRALQRSQHATLEDVPADLRDKLR